MTKDPAIRHLVMTTILIIAACTPLASSTEWQTHVPAPDVSPSPSVVRSTPPILPTMDYDLQDELYGLLANGATCRLPCFLGVIPDKTAIESALAFLDGYSAKHPLVPDESASSPETTVYNVPIYTSNDVDLQMYLRLGADTNGLVKYIRVQATWSRLGSYAANDRHLVGYSLRGIFQTYGLPDAMYMEPIKEDVYSIYAVYESVKFVVGFTGHATLDESGTYRVCPNIGDGDLANLDLATAAAADSIDVKTLIGYPFWSTPPFQQTAGIDLKGFYGLITGDHEPACFEVRSSFMPSFE